MTGELFINGKFEKQENGSYFEVENPSTEEIIGYASDASDAQVDYALESASAAYTDWAMLSIMQREKYLKVLIELIQEDKENLARLLTLEQGKTYKDALCEVDDTIFYIREACDTAKRLKGDIYESVNQGEKASVENVPYGVCIALCAWNYPLALVGRKIGPALITGNTVIVKPHELTPLATAEFFKLVEKANFPKGVINLITGKGIASGQRLVESKHARLVSLTGSVGAGQAVYRSSANNIAKLILELGGKAPFIVLEDADIEKAAEAVVLSRYSNCGQICICADMVFVQESIAEKFTQAVLERVKRIKVGNPFDESTTMGAKLSKADLEKINGIVEKTVAQGGTLLYGGKRPDGAEFEKGYWYMPTVLTDVTMDMAAAQEEIFGPVLPIIKIKDFNDAVKYTNSSEYGLAAYLFTQNYSTITAASRVLEVGTVFINTEVTAYFNVFHNGHKLSGIGGEDGEYGVGEYLQKRVTYAKY